MSDSINPNTPVTSNLNNEGALELNASAGPVSFDELEQLTLKSKGKDRAVKEEKPEKAEKVEKVQDKSIDLTSDTDKGKKVEAKEPKETKEAKETEAKPVKEGETEAKTPEEMRKIIKAKMKDAEIDLDEEALVPVKVNGKEEFVQIKELLGNYSGKVAWDKKFTEIDKMRKTVAADQLKMNEVSQMIKAAYEEQDPNLKLYRMSQIAGIDPVEFRTKFFNEQIQMLEKYYMMSDDERKADAAAYEASVHKHRADTLERSIKEQQEVASLHSKVESLRASHQISEQEFVDKYDQLLEQVKTGQLKAKITPETVVEAVKAQRLYDAAASELEKLNLGWTETEKAQKLFKLVESAHNLRLSPNDIPEMVSELWGTKKAHKKIEEKMKENEEFLTGKKPVSQARPPSPEIWSFDQM